MCGSAEGVFDYNVCLGEALFDAASFQDNRFASSEVAALVNRRSVGSYRDAGVGNERERGIFDLYQVEGVLGDVFVASGYCGYFVTDEPHLSVEYWDVRGDATYWHVKRRDDGVDSGQVVRRCRVNRDNCRVWVRTSEYLAGKHTRELHVRGVFRLARELSREVTAGDRLSNRASHSTFPAAITDRIMAPYALQRQMFPARAERISSSVGLGFCSRSAVALMRNPGVQ